MLLMHEIADRHSDAMDIQSVASKNLFRAASILASIRSLPVKQKVNNRWEFAKRQTKEIRLIEKMKMDCHCFRFLSLKCIYSVPCCIDLSLNQIKCIGKGQSVV